LPTTAGQSISPSTFSLLLTLIHLQCDEGRPSCKRCIARNDVCEGYRDESTLLFRSENEKAARKVATLSRPTPPSSDRGSSTTPSAVLDQEPPNSVSSTSISIISSPTDEVVPHQEDPTDLSAGLAHSLNLSNPYPWARDPPSSSKKTIEDQAVDSFFEKYVMYPCNSGSSSGFLEFLPPLCKEGNSEGRVALRWAVRAASYASLSNELDNAALGSKALECYGLALQALGEVLKDPECVPNDYDFMTIVVLDIFEVSIRLIFHENMLIAASVSPSRRSRFKRCTRRRHGSHPPSPG
jgi:hypothetical protein